MALQQKEGLWISGFHDSVSQIRRPHWVQHWAHSTFLFSNWSEATSVYYQMGKAEAHFVIPGFPYIHIFYAGRQILLYTRMWITTVLLQLLLGFCRDQFCHVRVPHSSEKVAGLDFISLWNLSFRGSESIVWQLAATTPHSKSYLWQIS